MTRTVWRVDGYAADAPFIDSPRDARYHSRNASVSRSSYELVLSKR